MIVDFKNILDLNFIRCYTLYVKLFNSRYYIFHKGFCVRFRIRKNNKFFRRHIAMKLFNFGKCRILRGGGVALLP